MDAVVHEFHARFRGDGFEWDPPLPEGVSGGGPGDIEVWSGLATMALAAPAGWWLEAAVAGGALWRLERHDASRRTGVRGGVVRLGPLGKRWQPAQEARPPDAEGLASLLEALRGHRQGPLELPSAVAAAALGRQPAVVRLFAAAERPLPELVVLAADESAPLPGTGVTGDAGARILRLAAAPVSPSATARRLVAWCLDKAQAASWPVPADGDAPLRRYLHGPWSKEADELLAEVEQLAAAPASSQGSTVGWLEVPAAVAMLARCEVVLGTEPRRIATRTVEATHPPALHLGAGEAVLEVPLGVTSFADQAQLIEIVHSVADRALAERLEAEFRQKCKAAPPLSAGWWHLRGVPGERLAEHAIAAPLTLDELRTLVPPVLERDILTPAEREQLGRGLLTRLQSLPPGQHRTTAAGFSGIATRLGHAPLTRWLTRANPTPTPSPRPAPPKAQEASPGAVPQAATPSQPPQATRPAEAPWFHRLGMSWVVTLLLGLCGGYLIGRMSIPTAESPDMASPAALSLDAGTETLPVLPPPTHARETPAHSPLLVELLETPPAALDPYRPYLSSCNGYGDLELLTSGRLLLVLCGGHGDDTARTSAVCLENRCIELAKLKSKKALPRLCTRTGAVAEPILHEGKPGYRIVPAGTGCHRAPYLPPLTAKGTP
ncbi:MAG TPA: hypothetical protein VH877_21530 [Polyangia bacterium]|jgi:hypothetical protein|nr:hypothetical protein [Polyangia bacterium]